MKKLSKTAWIAFGIVCAVVLFFVGIIGYRLNGQSSGSETSRQQNLYFPPAFELTPVDKPVIGNLGGLLVTFPPNFAKLVEYDGDPGFGEKRVGPRPERTHESGIRSMGFDVRYPDFSVMPRKEREADKKKFTIYNTPWIGVGVNASSDFGDGGFLERSVAHMNREPKFQYERLAEDQFGLEAYTPNTVDVSKRFRDPETGVYQSDTRDRDVFVHRDENGRVDTLIRCSNRQHHAAPCTHYFYIGLPLKIKMNVDYRRGQLEHWQEIQSNIKRIVLGFKVVG